MNSTWALIRSVRGPIVLIVLGILFALDQSDTLQFSRSWPILIIVFGLLKLAERSFAPPAVYAPHRPPGSPPPITSAPAAGEPPFGGTRA